MHTAGLSSPSAITWRRSTQDIVCRMLGQSVTTGRRYHAKCFQTVGETYTPASLIRGRRSDVEKQLAYGVINTASKQHRDVRREKETRNNKCRPLLIPPYHITYAVRGVAIKSGLGGRNRRVAPKIFFARPPNFGILGGGPNDLSLYRPKDV